MEDKIILITAMLFEIASDSSVYSKKLEKISEKLIAEFSEIQKEKIIEVLNGYND